MQRNQRERQTSEMPSSGENGFNPSNGQSSNQHQAINQTNGHETWMNDDHYYSPAPYTFHQPTMHDSSVDPNYNPNMPRSMSGMMPQPNGFHGSYYAVPAQRIPTQPNPAMAQPMNHPSMTQISPHSMQRSHMVVNRHPGNQPINQPIHQYTQVAPHQNGAIYTPQRPMSSQSFSQAGPMHHPAVQPLSQPAAETPNHPSGRANQAYTSMPNGLPSPVSNNQSNNQRSQQPPHSETPPLVKQQVLSPSTNSLTVLITLRTDVPNQKKKTWPSRSVLSNETWTFSQLLFCAANLSSFLSVSLNGVQVPNENRLVDCSVVRDYINAIGQGDSVSPPKIDVVFDLPGNIKSCTRLGCPNLLVNKANRRACSVCQSQGAELFPGQVRMVNLNLISQSANHPTNASAYLDLYLDQFDHWKFDGSEDGCQFIVFTDEATAQRVSTDMRTNYGDQSINLLQSVDPSQSYLIRMKSHFWMLQVKPLDMDPNNQSINQSKIRLYKKVGKPNQSRSHKDKDKEEKEESKSSPYQSMSTICHSNNQPIKNEHHEMPQNNLAVVQPNYQPPNHLINQSINHLYTQSTNHADPNGARSPSSDFESETSSVNQSIRSYPSLPSLTQTPSSPDSYHSGSSSMISQANQANGHMTNQARPYKRHAASLEEESNNQSIIDRRVSFSQSSDESFVSSELIPDLFSQAMAESIDPNDNLLSITDQTFYSMKQNKPVPALMQIMLPPQSLVVNAMSTQPLSRPNGINSDHMLNSQSINQSNNQSNNQPPSSVRTPVVLVYRDMQSYEQDRRRMKKLNRIDDPSGKGSNNHANGDEHKERGPGSNNNQHNQTNNQFSNGQSNDHKRRRYDAFYARDHNDDGSFLDLDFNQSANPPNNQSFHPDDLFDGGPFMDVDMFKPPSKPYDMDVLRMMDQSNNQGRLVLMPADFADMLMDPSKMSSLYKSLKQQSVNQTNSQPDDATNKQLSFFDIASESLLDDEPHTDSADDDQSKELQIVHPDNQPNPRPVKYSINYSTIKKYRAHPWCEWLTLFVGCFAFLLLLTLMINPEIPVLTQPSHPSVDPSNTQNTDLINGMATISPVFSTWSNSTVAGASKLGHTASVSSACLDSVAVSRAVGDWLLFSQGTREVYRSLNIASTVSARQTCSVLMATEVGPTYLRAVMCSALSSVALYSYTSRLCFSGTGWTQPQCEQMLSDLHTSGYTALAFLGLEENDRAEQWHIKNATTPDPKDSPYAINEYLNVDTAAVNNVETLALAYHWQALSLMSTCLTYTVSNTIHMQPNGNAQQVQQSNDQTRVIEPVVLALIIIGAPGLWLALQSMGVVSMAVVMKCIKKHRRRWT